MRSSNAKYETGMLAIDTARPGSVTTNTLRRLVRSTHGPAMSPNASPDAALAPPMTAIW